MDTKSKINELLKEGVITQDKVLCGIILENALIIDNEPYLYSENNISKKLENKIQSIYIERFKNMPSYKDEVRQKCKDLHNSNIEKVKVDLERIKIKELAKIINEELSDRKLLMNMGNGVTYPLGKNRLDRLKEGTIDKSALSDAQNSSDPEVVKIKDYTTTIELSVITGAKTRAGGSSFKYLHNTIFNFDKYGIFKEVITSNYKHNCLYLALEAGGLSNELLQKLKLIMKVRHLHKCNLKEICEGLQICIKLKCLRNDGRQKIEVYGDINNTKFDIGLVEDHYFIIDIAEITSYSLLHYEDVKHIKDCHKIYKKEGELYKKSNTRYINSFELFKILLENKEVLLSTFKHSEEIMKTQIHDDVDDFGSLSYIETSVMYEEYKSKAFKDNYYKVFFDFETITSDKDKDGNMKHIPYLCCYETEDGDKRRFEGLSCARDMLDSLLTLDKKHVLLIAHNANYDARFLLQYLYNMRPLLKGERFLSINGKYKNIEIIIKDSYKIIDMPLSKFGESFKLPIEKEVMPYKIYTEENINIKFISIYKAKCIIKSEMAVKCKTEAEIQESIDKFVENIEKWKCYGEDKDTYNIMEYSARYCEMDCSVLHQGYDIFKEWMLMIGDLNIDNYITIQSLAGDMVLKRGCYDEVYKISGIPQAFISRCMVGGRCMTRDNKMYHIKSKITDCDACSLYPSAIMRLLGYLKGKPKVIKPEELNYDFLKNTDGYFIRIKVLKVNKHLHFPLESKIDKNGVRQFTNNMENEIIFIDKIRLEDYIKYQEIEFEIIDGYYYNEGRNNKICELINTLFNLRLQMKKDKNPAELVIKLLMNSIYGKTIMRPVESDTIVKESKEDFEKYVSYNYNYIDSFVEVDGRYYIKRFKSVLNHFNYSNCGVEILSMSKRLMNEVMCLAENNNIDIYYQDTDSMHLKVEDMPKLEALYYEEYGRALNGKNLGQFHPDLSMKGAIGDVYANECYFLCKKVYIDVLVGQDENGNEITDYHIRMRGIPSECIRYKASHMRGKTPIIDIYKKLYNGESIVFDLTSDGYKASFEFNKRKEVLSRNTFERNIKMDKDIERIEII